MNKKKYRKIFIVNNKEIIKDILSQRIKLLGYETNSVSNGKEAKEQRNPFDIIIMDLTIPGGMVGKKNNKKIFKIDKDAKVISPTVMQIDQY